MASNKAVIPDPTDPQAKEKLFQLIKREARRMGLNAPEHKEGEIYTSYIMTPRALPGVTILASTVPHFPDVFLTEYEGNIFRVTVYCITEPLVERENLKGRREDRVPRLYFVFRTDGTVQERTDELEKPRDPFYRNWEAGIAAIMRLVSKQLSQISSLGYMSAYHARRRCRVYKFSKAQRPPRPKKSADSHPF